MSRPKIGALALIAVAGSMLAFEFLCLALVYPGAARAMARTPLAFGASRTFRTMPFARRAGTLGLGRIIVREQRRSGVVMVRETTVSRGACDDCASAPAQVREAVMSALREAVL
ncbi:MAG: hypothetical protein HY076_06460 [Candidatus Eisenbacteria bacterium]|uniref:Uncharacterized protein n=1 Tax=Eiseniibacteriota bacterium TaxID=2212470 RepID=A0A9D6LAI6_UNCEI|nr:hypothetical protein [Candidatus Eisenbacteria bacterium]